MKKDKIFRQQSIEISSVLQCANLFFKLINCNIQTNVKISLIACHINNPIYEIYLQIVN